MDKKFNSNNGDEVIEKNASQQYNNTTISPRNDNNQNISGDKITLYDLNALKPIENMPYIYCPNCKNKVIANANFCSLCGTKISGR